MADMVFRIRIDSKELKQRLMKRVAYHEQRMKHYLKLEAQALKEKLKKEKEAMERERIQVEELDLALAQERSSYQGYSGCSGYSGYSPKSTEFKHTVTIGHSEKFISHERAARKLQFIAEHLKEEDYELDQYEIDRLELV